MQIEMVANGDEPEVVLQQATLLVNQYKAERERLQVIANEANEALAAALKRIGELQLENTQLRNDMQTTDALCEELRAETAELRGIFASIAVMVGAFEIAVPVRKHNIQATSLDNLDRQIADAIKHRRLDQ